MKIFCILLTFLTQFAYGQNKKSIINRALNQDICLNANVSSVQTDALCVDGPTGRLEIGASPTTDTAVHTFIKSPSGEKALGVYRSTTNSVGEVFQIFSDVGGSPGDEIKKTVIFADGSIQAFAGSITVASYSSLSDPDTGIYFPAANNIGFTTNGTSKGSINSSGLWTIGASGGSQSHVVNGTLHTVQTSGDSSEFAGVPQASRGLLHLRPNAGNKGYITFTEDGVSDRWAIGFDNGASAFNFRQSSATGTSVANINFTTGVYTATSDIKLKKDIEKISYGLNDVMLLNPVSYRMKQDDSKLWLGLIAQEVEPIIPEVVSVLDQEKDIKGIQYANLIPVLIKAIQELTTKVQELERRIEELEN